MAKTQTSINGGGEVVLYEAPDGEVRLDVRLEQETVWLTQRQMADTFRTTTPVIVSMHFEECLMAKESWTEKELLRIFSSSHRGQAARAAQTRSL